MPSVRRSAIRGSSPISGGISSSCGGGTSSKRLSPIPSGPGPDRRAAEREVELRGRLGGPGMDWTNCYTTGDEGPRGLYRELLSMAGPSIETRRGRRTVRISSADKLLFPADGITKADLGRLLRGVAPVMAPHVKDRPLNLWRWNAGIDKPVVIQQAIPKGAPGVGRTVTVERRKGGDVTHAVGGEPPRSSGSPTRTASRRTRGRAAPTAPASPTASSSTSTRPTRTRRPTSPSIRAGALLLGERLRGARAHPLRDDLRLARAARRRPAAPPPPRRRRPRPRRRARRRAGPRRARRGPHDVLAQGEARGPRPARHRAQHLRADDRGAVRGPRDPGRAGRGPARLGGARGPGAAPAAPHAAHGAGPARGARRPLGGIAKAAAELPRG